MSAGHIVNGASQGGGLLAKVGGIFKVGGDKQLSALPGSILARQKWAATQIKVEQDFADCRLDRVITIRCSLRVQVGDVISLPEVFLPEKSSTVLDLESISPETIKGLQDTVLYKDENIMVINKPAGMAVHGAKEEKANLESFLNAFRFELDEAPRLVHRLDKNTTGALILARNRKAADDLAARFRESQLDESIQKYYWAMVKGTPPVKEGRVISNIYKAGEYPNEKMTSMPDKRVDILDEGKVAITKFRQVGLYIRKDRFGHRHKLSLMQLEPVTGRTHQLRVHLAEQLDLPIIGDLKYGGNRTIPGPLHLHSRKIILKDYPTKDKSLTVEAPLPKHFVKTMLKYPLFLRKKPKFPKKRLHNL